MKTCQTKTLKLPGGDFSDQASLVDTWLNTYPFISKQQAQRFARQYGSLANHFLAHCQTNEDLGLDFGAGLSQVEVDYLVEHEFVTDIEDILWRRTKLGLYQKEINIKGLTDYLERKLTPSISEQSDLSSVA